MQDDKLFGPADLPELPPNARYVFHENRCFDWGTIGWAIQEGKVDTAQYRHIIFMNSSVRGPFLPGYYPVSLLGRLASCSRLCCAEGRSSTCMRGACPGHLQTACLLSVADLSPNSSVQLTSQRRRIFILTNHCFQFYICPVPVIMRRLKGTCPERNHACRLVCTGARSSQPG